MPKKNKTVSKERETPVVDEASSTNANTNSKPIIRKRSAVDKIQISAPPKRTRKNIRPLKDHEISENLMAESDDNCSDFDDDIQDPDFVLESNHNTESEQSENEEDQGLNPEVEVVHIGVISPDCRQQVVEENTNEIEVCVSESSNNENKEEIINKNIRKEQSEHIQNREGVHNEQAISDDQEPNGEFTRDRPRYFYGKNRYKWSSVEPSRASRVRSHNIVNVQQQVSLTEFTCYEDLWKLFFTEDMIEKIIRHTNAKLNNHRARYKDTGRSELGPSNKLELKALIGLLFYTSVFHSNHENAEFIFATDGTGREIFRCVMSKNRFLVLLNCLRFDDAETRTERLKEDKLAAISELFDSFISNCKQNYTLGTHVCIDEMLVGFRGRCKFKIYMPNKPNKYGLKVLLLVDAHTFYVYNAYVYHGRGSDSEGLNEEEKRLGIPSQSVIRLSKGLEGSNRNITADNWFTSIELLLALKDRGLTYLGTMKKKQERNSSGIPAS